MHTTWEEIIAPPVSMIPPLSKLVSPWFTPPITFIPCTPAPCPPAPPRPCPTPSIPMASCSPTSPFLMPVTGCLSGVPVTSVSQPPRSFWPTCVPTPRCPGWWTVSCYQPTLHRCHPRPPATSTSHRPAAQVPSLAPSPLEGLLVWVWHATTPTANPIWPVRQDFPCLPFPPPPHTTPPTPSTVKDWAQPQPWATSDGGTGVKLRTPDGS